MQYFDLKYKTEERPSYFARNILISWIDIYFE